MKIRDYFKKNPDGSWEPLAPLTIKTNMGEVTIVPGTSFRTGVEFMGLDIAALCEQDADI